MWAYALAVLGFVFTGSGASATEGGPANLILISIDTLRADHLGCYGYARPTSPMIDALAAAGVVFTDVSAPSPWTRPSHASLLTGLYPSRHGVKTHAHRLAESIPTLATLLAAAGYRTLAVVNSEHLSAPFGLPRGFSELEYVSEVSGWPWRRRLGDSGDVVTERALALLGREDPRPFFLFVHYYDPHSDYSAASEYARHFVRPYDGRLNGSTKQLLRIQQAKLALSPQDVSHLVDLYDGEIRQVDAEVGRILAHVDARGSAERTIVALTSDHGEEFFEHGTVLHGYTLYQEVIAVPLILRGPGIPHSIRIPEPVGLIDVAPTLLGLLGVAAPTAMDGIDLAPLWGTQSRPGNERALFADSDHRGSEPDIKRMVRRGRWKLHFDRLTEKTELYDLAADAGERVDRRAAEPRRAEELMEELRAFMALRPLATAAVTPDEAVQERMRHLGYQ